MTTAPEQPLLGYQQQTFKDKIIATVKQRKILIAFTFLNIISQASMAFFLAESVHLLHPYFVFWFTGIFFWFVFFAWYTVERLRGAMKPENMKAKHWQMAVIGFATTVNGICILFAAPYVPGPIQAVLGPAVSTIPMSMIISAIMLRRRYDIGRILCACWIVAASVISIVPQFSEKAGAKNKIPVFIWDAIFFLGSVPVAFLNVFEEKIFVDLGPVSPVYILNWSTLYQAISICLTAPLDWVPQFGSSSVSDFWKVQLADMKCLAGIEVSEYCVKTKGECHCTDWAALRFTIFFCVAYSLANFAAIGTVKYGNAAFGFICQAVSAPLAAVAFAIPFMVKPLPTTPFTIYNGIALFMLSVGMVAYAYFDSLYGGLRDEKDVATGGLSSGNKDLYGSGTIAINKPGQYNSTTSEAQSFEQFGGSKDLSRQQYQYGAA
eukprot:TRINITY_DN65677_c3_g5_i1.p1 TRINITY_DN65677_c3_g5~~TRINITY_DN65677_c3_g5_i1.p1  ORF type:complete len:435 (+),score=35.88 TRINITY_DN65677_c3_g5_i1:52-1356(+)